MFRFMRAYRHDVHSQLGKILIRTQMPFAPDAPDFSLVKLMGTPHAK